MTVWICQCLCPQRHTILAAAGEAEDHATAVERFERPLRQQIDDAVRTFLNPWCGICRAPRDSWQFETRRTRFATIAEAQPVLQQEEAKNILAMTILGKY